MHYLLTEVTNLIGERDISVFIKQTIEAKKSGEWAVHGTSLISCTLLGVSIVAR
jgi:hypothetical protein